MEDDLDPGMMPVKIGGREFPVKHEPQCAVCTSQYRLDIERALVAGYAYAKIRDSLPTEDGVPAPSTASMKKHIENMHVPLPQFQKRAIIEKRAQELGRSIEEGQGMLTDYIGVNEMLIQHGFESLQEGTMHMKASDLIGALKFQHEIEQSQNGTVDDEVWAEALMEYMRIVQKIMPAEMWDEFGSELSASPVIQAISRKMAGEADAEEIEVREFEE